MDKLIVVMPVYENTEGLIKSLESLVHEFDNGNFDVLLIDDNFIPKLHRLDYSGYPFKVIVLTNGTNFGVTRSLRIALNWIEENGEYIFMARLDAGDIVVNDRLKKQRTFLKNNSDCVLVGGAVEYVTTEGKVLYAFRPPLGDDRLRRKMHMNNYIAHPASMMRLAAVFNVGGYQDTYSAAEDYDLFWRLSQIGRIANLPEILLKYEISRSQVSLRKRRRQLHSRLQIQIRHFHFLRIESYLGVGVTILAFAIPWSYIIWLKAATKSLRLVRQV